jgi:hypothetical protein
MRLDNITIGRRDDRGYRASMKLFVIIVVVSILVAALAILQFGHRQTDVTIGIDERKAAGASEFVPEAGGK